MAFPTLPFFQEHEPARRVLIAGAGAGSTFSAGCRSTTRKP